MHHLDGLRILGTDICVYSVVRIHLFFSLKIKQLMYIYCTLHFARS